MTSTQTLPKEIALPERAHDIRGQVFGMLTALWPINNSQRGVSWLCECECGRHAIRTTAALNKAVKNCMEAQCVACLRELNRGISKNNIEWKRELHLLHWHKYGNLYTDGQVAAIKRSVTKDLQAVNFPVGEPLPDVLDGHGYDQSEPYGAISDGNSYTLEEIGLELNVSRERARQIGVRAMGKLLHNHRRLLVSLLTGEFDWRIDDVEKILAAMGKRKEETETEFSGCRCKTYEMVTPGYVYCRTCWKVWRVSERQAMQILTAALIRKSAIVEDDEEP
jgi:hypothetical protein